MVQLRYVGYQADFTSESQEVVVVKNPKALWVDLVIQGRYDVAEVVRKTYELRADLSSLKRPEPLTRAGTSKISTGEIEYDIHEVRWPFNSTRRVSTSER